MNKLNSRKFYLVLLLNMLLAAVIYLVFKYRPLNQSAWNYLDTITLAVIVAVDVGYLGLQSAIDGNWFGKKGKQLDQSTEGG